MRNKRVAGYVLGALTLMTGAMALLSAAKKDKEVRIFMVGDSTMANKKLDNDNQERGWGMMLPACFDAGVTIDNHAVNGRSSKSFRDEGRWEKVIGQLKKGDYVVIQFGHNDEKKSDAKRYSDAETTFRDNLRRYVSETRERGAIPILMNAVVRRSFTGPSSQAQSADLTVDDESLRDTKSQGQRMTGDSLADTHGRYAEVPREVAREMGVLFVDANQITARLEQTLGAEASRHLHMNYLPGEHPSLPDGREDNTHYNVRGATLVAHLLAWAMAEQVPELKKHLAQPVGWF